MFQAEQSDTFSVDGEVDVLVASASSEERSDRENVLPVRREVVCDNHSAARAVRRALNVVPCVLGHLDGVGVLHRAGRRRGVAHGQAAHLGRRPQVGLEKRGVEPLGVRQVVEGTQVGVGR